MAAVYGRQLYNGIKGRKPSSDELKEVFSQLTSQIKEENGMNDDDQVFIDEKDIPMMVELVASIVNEANEIVSKGQKVDGITLK